MRAFGSFFRRTGPGTALRVKSGDAFAACAEKFGITAREAEIIRLLLEGKDNRRITEELFISDHTVKNHIHNIYRKLNIRNRIQLVRCFQTALEEPGRPENGAAPAASAPFLRRVVLPGILALAAAAAVLVAWKPWDRGPRLAVRAPLPVLAVLDFENLSGDPDLEKWETGLPLLLITDLFQSKSLRTLGDDAVYGALKKLDLTATRRYSQLELRRLARELKADYLLAGSLIRAGDRIVVTAFLQDARTGAPVRTEKIEKSDEQGLMSGADELAKLVKSALALRSGRAPADVDLDVEVLTTSSALAYKYYTEGRRYHRTGDYEQSLQMLKMAVEIDPEFAMAYRAMASDARNLGYIGRQEECLRKAFELADRLPENCRERRLIRADYFSMSEDTLAQAAEEYKKVLEDNPYDLPANNNLGILCYELEDYEAAARYADVLVRERTADPFPHYTRAVSLWALGRSSEALGVLAAYHENHPANRLIYQTLVDLLIEARDFAGARAALEKAMSIFPDPSWAYWKGVTDYYSLGAAAAREEFRRLFLMDEVPWRLKAYRSLSLIGLAEGRFGDAGAESQRGAALAESIGELTWASDLRDLLAQALVNRGQLSGAVVEARAAVELARSASSRARLRPALHVQGVCSALAGDLAAADAAAQELQTLSGASPIRQIVRSFDLFRGEMELTKGRPREAIAALETALAKLPAGTAPGGDRPLMHFLLARAREMTGDLAGAAAAFGEVLEAPGNRLDLGHYYPLAVFGQARMHDKLGSSAAALEGYRSFLTLWKDADPGRPEVAEARARVAALAGS
jgi:DNA-binding CsgD family transcriptional regulator/tetratricopeptide (TPR) repeat protein